jgi:hypothetical protein
MELFEESIVLIDTIAQLQMCSHDDAVQFLFQQYMEKSFYESLDGAELLIQPIQLW